MERNVISKSTVIVGDIKSDGDFRIDGSIEGNLTIKGKVIIGVDGIILGNIEALSAVVEGKTSGKFVLEKTLTVKSTATISGEVTVGKLSIEPGANFNASCIMKEFSKDSKNEDGKRAKLKKIFK